MTKLFKHQEEGIRFLKKRKRAILADEMGLGKTRQAIIAMGDSADKGIIVVCPASLKQNWKREILMVYPEETIAVVDSGPTYTIEEAAWVIINYDMLPKYLDQLTERIDDGRADAVIVDEAHYIKSSTADRTKATLKLVADAKRVLLLTGTPLLNRPAELFTLLKAVKHPLGKAKTTFAKRYCGGQMKVMVRDLFGNRTFFVSPDRQWPFRNQKARYRVYMFMDDTGATHLDELKQFTKDVMLRRTKKEVLDLPEKIRSDVPVELTSDQRRTYDSAWDAYLEWLGAHPEAGRNIDNVLTAQQLIEVGKLKQVCSIAKVPRIVADVENALEQGEQIIIFTGYRQTLQDLRTALAHHETRYISGDMNSEYRQEAVDAFQGGKAKVMIANIQAGGVGITLTAASIVMFADLDWSPEVNAQAEDRAHRIGQEGTVNVYRYTAEETIDEDILRTLEEKKKVIQALI